MKYNAVIFDLDGTLLHTLEDLLDNLNFAFEKLGLNGNFNREEMESFLGSGKKAQMERALQSRGYSLDLIPALDELLSVRYELNAENKTRPFDGIIDLLNYLKAHQIKAICLTNKPHNVAVKVIDRYFAGLIEATYGVKDDGIVKPNPILVEQTLAKHSLKAEETLYVGDSDIDMLTAKNGHLDGVFVTWGYVRLHEVTQYEPKYIVDKPSQIIDILNHK